ncbi:MAG TPA: hypothetical protein VG722_05530, partial [Tepidisphaeraceae bacterium]|nr:hypothetical protein [Tepidisphaeraceae bacterium]
VQQHFIVAAPAEESDLTSLSPEQIQHLRQDLKMKVVAMGKTPTQTTAAGDTSLWPVGIALALSLAAAEMLMSKFWGQGRPR